MSWMEWLEALFEKYRWLFYAPEAPPVSTQETRQRAGAPGRKAPPPPPPKEPPLSPRRLLMAIEGIMLALAIVAGLLAWRGLLGGWPGRGNFDPPGRVQFGDPVLLEVTGEDAWLATAQELFLLDLKDPEKKAVKLRGKLPSRMVTAVEKAGNDFWIGTDKGLVGYSNGRIRRLPKKLALSRAHVTCLKVDGRGRLWAGTAENGLFLKDGKDWRGFHEELPSPYIRDIAAYGSRSVLVCPFSAGILKSDGETFSRVAMPFGLQRKAVSRIETISGADLMAMIGQSLYLFRGGKWDEVKLPAGDDGGGFKLRDWALLSDREALLLAGSGELYRLGIASGKVRPVAAAAKITAVAVYDGAIYTGQNGSLFLLGPEGHIPWTDWGEFIDLQRYQSPPADMPQEWGVERFRHQAFKLFLAALLLAGAMLVRSIRWALSVEKDGWRIMPLRRAALGAVGMALLFLAESAGLVSTRVHAIIWLPLLVLLVLAGLIHATRVIVHDWARAQDAFWLGIVIWLSLLGAWLWWGLGSLMPSLLVCALAGLFTARALRGLRRGEWRGFKFVWGLTAWAIQLAALLPPLLFAAGTWSKAALAMGSTASMVEGLSRIPERLTLSDDGLRLAFVTPDGPGKSIKIVDGSRPGWNVTQYATQSGEITPRFSPAGDLIAFCIEREGEAVVEIIDLDGKRRWLARVPGVPAPGWQPWWSKDGDSLLLLTARGTRTDLWRLDRIGSHAFKRDAERIATVGKRLAWPYLSADGESLVCASEDGGVPGMVRIFLKSGIVKSIVPRVSKKEPTYVYAPSEAGEAVNAFLKGVWRGMKGCVRWCRRSLNGVLGYLGWEIDIPELWTRPPGKAAATDRTAFKWADYQVVRDVVESARGTEIVCVARHRSGRDHLLYMGGNGEDVRIIRSTRGHLLGVRWTGYRNRIMAVQEGRSPLAPFQVRTLLMMEVLPEAVRMKAMSPFSHWVAAPQFSPDGLRVLYAAPDQFWRVALRPSSTFSIYEVLLETSRRALNPPGGGPVESAH